MTTVLRIRFFSEGHMLEGKAYVPVDCGEPTFTNLSIVLCHGYAGVQALYFPEIAHRLCALGITVLSFDYKGWGESEGSRNRLAPYSRVADILAAVTILTERVAPTTNRIGLMEWSFGGSTAIVAGALDDRIDFVISIFGVGDGRRWLRSVRSSREWEDLLGASEGDRVRRATLGRSKFVPKGQLLKLDTHSANIAGAPRERLAGAVDELPLEFIDETLTFVPELFAGRLKDKATQLIASNADRVVPIAESQALYAAVSGPKEFVEIDGYGHYDLYTGAGLDLVMSNVARFLGGLLK